MTVVCDGQKSINLTWGEIPDSHWIVGWDNAKGINKYR